METVTHVMESEIEPERIYAKLADPVLIPQWAPVFAESVEPVGGSIYRVTKGGDTFSLEVVTNKADFAVEYLRDLPGGKRGGAYLRVMPGDQGGSVISMRVPVGPNRTPEEVEAVLEQELQALVKLA